MDGGDGGMSVKVQVQVQRRQREERYENGTAKRGVAAGLQLATTHHSAAACAWPQQRCYCIHALPCLLRLILSRPRPWPCRLPVRAS